MANELILIIEDDANSRKLVRDVLRIKGYQTIESETAEEGIRLAKDKQPALILMDIQLPGISGIEALKILRTEPQSKSIPVIAVTASVMNQQQSLITDAGFDDFEGKPVSVAGLLKKVRKLLDRTASSA